MKPEDLASAVVGVVKSTMAPLLERLAGVEAHIKILGDVRDRMIGLEVKSAIPPAFPEIPEPVDVSPIVARIVALEGQAFEMGRLAGTWNKADLHDRLEALESKSKHVVDPDGTLDAALRDIVKEFATIRERLAIVESRAAVPGPVGPAGKDGTGADLDTLKKSVQSLVTDAIAALPPARDGKDGKDGSDGVTLDDLSVEQQDERTLVVKATVGAKVKEIGSVTFPVNIYRGVYLQGKSYEPGDLITWDGSLWHANKQTTEKPVDGSKVWTLAAKRGRDAARL